MFIKDEDVQKDGSCNIPFLDHLEEQRQLAPHIAPAPSWNLPENDVPSSGIVPVNRGKSFYLPLCLLLSLMVDLLRRTTRAGLG